MRQMQIHRRERARASSKTGGRHLLEGPHQDKHIDTLPSCSVLDIEYDIIFLICGPLYTLYIVLAPAS